MNSNIKRWFAATAITSAALAGTAVAAPEAEAKVHQGQYTLVQRGNDVFGRPMVDYGRAYVRGRVLTIHNNGQWLRLRITPTRRGGYADVDFRIRLIFNKGAHGRYSGPAYSMGVRSGSVTLIPR